MPPTQGHALASPPEQAKRSQLPSTPPASLPGESDPVLRRSRPTLFNGPILIMVVASVGFGLYEARNLPHLVAFLSPAPSAGDTHSAATPSLFYWLPMVLVLSSATILLTMALTALLGRRRARESAAPRVGFAQPNELGVKPFRPTRREERHRAMEAVRLRRDAKASEVARAVASERHLEVVPARPPRAIHESLPSLPIHPQVRRRDPRKGLPRALAAALKVQVAAGPRRRSAVADAEAAPASS